MESHPIFTLIDNKSAQEIAEITVESLIGSSDMGKRLNEMKDIEFLFPILLYSLKLENFKNTERILRKILIDESSILNRDSFNKYVVLFYQTIPIIFTNENLNHIDQSAIKIFLSDLFRRRALFEIKTWKEYVDCILKCIENIVPHIQKNSTIAAKLEGMPSTMSELFFDFFGEVDLDNFGIESLYDKLVIFINIYNKESIFEAGKYNIINIFRKLYLESIKPENDKSIKNMCYKKMRLIIRICCKLDEDKTCNESFLSHCFDNLIKNTKDKIKSLKVESSLFQVGFPSDLFIKHFPECVFIKTMKNIFYTNYDYIKSLFKIFSKQDINEKYLALLPKYINYILRNYTFFSVVFPIINNSSNFIAVYPQFFNQMLNIIIQKAGELKYNKEDDKQPKSSDIQQLWINTFGNIFEFAQIDNNQDLKKLILANINKFATSNDFIMKSNSEVKENFLIQVLIFLISTGFDDFYERRLLDMEEYIKEMKLDENQECKTIRIFSFYTLIIVSFFSKKIKPKTLDNLIFMVKSLCCSPEMNPINDKSVILCFLFTLSEVFAQPNSCLSSERSLFFSIIDLLNIIKKIFHDDSDIQEMSEFLKNTILVPTITPNFAYLKKEKMTNVQYFVNDSNILTVGNLENDRIGIIVRNKYGISSFDLKEIKKPKLEPAPEKENVKYLYRSVLNFDKNYLPFENYNKKISNDIKENVLSSLLFFEFINEKSKFTQYPSTEIEPLLNKFDSYCDRCIFKIRICKVDFNHNVLLENKDNASNSFNTFLSHLEKSFTRFCQFDFTIKDIQSNIIILFNDTNKDFIISEEMKKERKLIIIVSPQDKSLSSNILSYKLRVVVTPDVKGFISPIPLKKWRIVSVENLSKFIGIICFFYKGIIDKGLNCEIIENIIKKFHDRKNEIETILDNLSKERKESLDSFISYCDL